MVDEEPKAEEPKAEEPKSEAAEPAPPAPAPPAEKGSPAQEWGLAAVLMLGLGLVFWVAVRYLQSMMMR